MSYCVTSSTGTLNEKSMNILKTKRVTLHNVDKKNGLQWTKYLEDIHIHVRGVLNILFNTKTIQKGDIASFLSRLHNFPKDRYYNKKKNVNLTMIFLNFDSYVSMQIFFLAENNLYMYRCFWKLYNYLI